MEMMEAAHIPSRDLLAAIGEVSLRHEQMHHALKMMIKSLANLKPAEAIAAIGYDGAMQLRKDIQKLARKVLSIGTPYYKVRAMLTVCEKLTEERNTLIHGLWAEKENGETHIRDIDGTSRPLPTAEQLKHLADEMAKITHVMHRERLKGFLAKALAEIYSTPAKYNHDVNK